MDKFFSNLITSRHSVRAFKNTPISEETIDMIINTAIKGPSAGNLQSYQIFIITKDAEKEKLAEAAHGQNYIREAPIVMIFCADPLRCSAEYGFRGEQLFSIQDATIACAYAQIAAHELGFSSVWIGSFNDDKVQKILKIEHFKPIAILPIGLANETPQFTPRRPTDEISHRI